MVFFGEEKNFQEIHAQTQKLSEIFHEALEKIRTSLDNVSIMIFSTNFLKKILDKPLDKCNKIISLNLNLVYQ